MTLKWCKELRTEIIASVTRGYARGLGGLSKYLVLPHLKEVLDTLIQKSLITEKEETRDYETRKFCVIALADLMESIGVNEHYEYQWSADEDMERKEDDDGDAAEEAMMKSLGIDLDVTKEKHERNRHHKPIEDEQFVMVIDTKGPESTILYDRIMSAILQRFEDYEVDRRGDIGSFVRQHALMQVFRVLVMLKKAGKKEDGSAWLRPEIPTAVLNVVLRQLSEKLDRVRRAAGEVMELLFDSEDEDIQSIEFDDDAQIRSIFAGHSTKDGGLDWSNPGAVFPLLVQALDLEGYRRSIMEGMF